MYKAKQDQLIQQTNQGLINIRQAEINYHVNVNATFGTQAALIGGFTYGTFLRDFDTYRTWSHHTQTAFYIMASITVSSSILVIVLTMLIHVMAPGLALNGPVGSMARATEGLKKEQHMVMCFFCVMMVSFTIATVLAVWTIMDNLAAIGASFVFLVAAVLAYYYIRRVYARFFYIDDSKWEEMSDVDPIGRSRNSSSYTYEQRDTLSPMQNGDQSALNTAANAQPAKKTRQSSMFGWLVGGDKTDTALEMNKINGVYNEAEHKIHGKDVAMEGYLTKRIKSKKEFLKDPWERRYFVLNYRGEFFYYRNRQEYRKAPVTGREEAKPIELDEYLVKYYNSVTPNALQVARTSGEQSPISNEDSSSPVDQNVKLTADGTDASPAPLTKTTSTTLIVTPGNNGSSGDKAIFQFKLVPLNGREVRLHYGLRCDTEEEFMMWLEVMQEVSTANFEESYFSDK